MSLPQPDPSTVRKAQRGDEHAFAQLVSAYELPIYTYVARMVVGDRALADDLTQEIFLRVHHGIAGFSLRCRFTTWLFQIAKNRVLDELRARDRRPETDSIETVVRGLEVVDAPPEQVELVGAVWKAVAVLNPDLKMALLLRDIVGLSYSDIADSLEITLATVKWRIYKAREEVQRTLEQDGMTGDLSAPGELDNAH